MPWTAPPTPPARPMTRADLGLAAGEHLFLCARNPRKIHPAFDPLATGILERDPRARVLLIGSREGAETAPLRQHWRDTLRRDNGAIFQDDRAIGELQNAWDIMLGDV